MMAGVLLKLRSIIREMSGLPIQAVQALAFTRTKSGHKFMWAPFCLHLRSIRRERSGRGLSFLAMMGRNWRSSTGIQGHLIQKRIRLFPVIQLMTLPLMRMDGPGWPPMGEGFLSRMAVAGKISTSIIPLSQGIRFAPLFTIEMAAYGWLPVLSVFLMAGPGSIIQTR